MAFLDNHGRMARVFYTNVLYAAMTLLAALVCAALNAEYDDNGTKGPRFEACAVGSADGSELCPALDDDSTNQNQQLFNISLATAILNGLLFLWSVLTHWGKSFGIALAFRLQLVFSLVNVGLFAGLVGWFNATKFDDSDAFEANAENNVFYQDYNPYIISIVGLVAGCLDTVLFHALDRFYFKASCAASQASDDE